MNKPLSLVILTHGRFGEELLSSAELIFGKIENACALSLLSGVSIEEFYESAKKEIISKPADTLILTDLYAGTPCNVAMMLSRQFSAKVLCGVNLPLLIELVNFRDNCDDIEKLLEAAVKAGKESILRPEQLEENNVNEDGDF